MMVRHPLEGLKSGNLCHDVASLFAKHGAFEVLMSLHSFAADQAEFALGDKADVAAWSNAARQFRTLAEKVKP